MRPDGFQARFDAALARYVLQAAGESEVLLEAMRYALEGKAKRLRARLAYLTSLLVEADSETLDRICVAVECIHAYSLIHDDLPCMDDDDMRRGKPSTHVAFGEATALIAGDALQALAFEIVAAGASPNAAKLVELLAQGAGVGGMCAGQTLDMLFTARKVSYDELMAMHALKTGALIRASALMGLYAGRDLPSEALVKVADAYARHLGVLFQITDDVLDATATTDELGKTAGKDAAQAKSTYVTLLGLGEARRLAAETAAKALAAVENLPKARPLAELVLAVRDRTR